jgi:hypothetical protein
MLFRLYCSGPYGGSYPVQDPRTQSVDQGRGGKGTVIARSFPSCCCAGCAALLGCGSFPLTTFLGPM